MRRIAAPTLRALQAIRASVNDGEPIHVILDNLNHHKNRDVREWCAANRVELAFTPTYGSWANPIEAHFGPLRQFVIANSDHRSGRLRVRSASTSVGATPHTPRPRSPRGRTPPPRPSAAKPDDEMGTPKAVAA